jgi:hypothetical protein
MPRNSFGSAERVKRLHRDRYYWICADEIAKRGGIVLDEVPKNSPLWGECYRMTEEIYGLEDPSQNYIWHSPAKENRIVTDLTLTHAERVPLIEAIHKEWEEQYRKREKKREAAKAPEQRAREKASGKSFDRWVAPMMEPAIATLEESGAMDDITAKAEALLDEIGIPNDAERKFVEVVERPFDEHLTDADGFHAHSFGIRLD